MIEASKKDPTSSTHAPTGKAGPDQSGFQLETDPFALNQTQWDAVSAANPGLGPEVRQEIERAIIFYRAESQAAYTSLATKRKLQSALGSSKKLEQTLRQLKLDRTFRVSGRSKSESNFQRELSGISNALDALSKLETLLEGAQTRIKSPRGRKSSKPLVWFFFELIKIQERCVGKPLRRSIKTGSVNPSNPFIRACAKIADASEIQD
jgi:hypothetical protein